MAGDYDMGSLALPKGSDEGKEDPLDMDAEEVCEMAIDAALNGCGSSEDRREAFKRAVLMVVEQYAK